MTTQQRTLAVWCAEWPVTAAGALPHEPAVALRQERVVSATAAARKAGVRNGQKRREAEAHAPGLTVIEIDQATEAMAFEPVAVTLSRLAPRIEVLRPGLALCKTKGPSRYYGGEEAFANLVQRTVAMVTDTEVGVGVADGAYAAAQAARFGRRSSAGDGVYLVEEGKTAAFLAPLPISVLDNIGMAGVLGRLGLRTLDDLASLPEGAVLGRFGSEGHKAWLLAGGKDPFPMAPAAPPADLSVGIEFDPPAFRVDAVAFAVRGLAARLHETLAARGLACTRLLIEATTTDGRERSRLWRSEDRFSASATAERLRWQLEGWLSEHRRGCEGDGAEREDVSDMALDSLRLVPDEVLPDHGRQLGFWSGDAEDDERAAMALARIQGILGPEGVTTAVLVGGRGPAEQVRLVPWGNPRDIVPQETAPWPGSIGGLQPVLLPADPLPITVVDAANQPVTVSGRGLASAPPARVRVDTEYATGGKSAVRWETVTSWAGPWPYEERWWDPNTHRRQARVQVTTEGGAAYLLTLSNGCWRLEAIYD